MSDVKVIEREWSDKFGTHYEVRAQGPDGRIYQRTITNARFMPPGVDREAAYRAVKAMADGCGEPRNTAHE